MSTVESMVSGYIIGLQQNSGCKGWGFGEYQTTGVLVKEDQRWNFVWDTVRPLSAND